jgi:uncharacterized protein (TIGR02145 family)
MKKTTNLFVYPMVIMVLLIMLINSCSNDENNNTNVPSDTVRDIDGNLYHTVKIGTQVWMVENLKTTKYRNGTAIPKVADSATWCNLTTPGFCDYNNTDSNYKTYGRLYNWFAIDDYRNLAPAEWHVSTSADWTTLINFLGGASVAGAKLKEIGFNHWSDPNTGATNSSGFTALPGGGRNNFGSFFGMGHSGNWWTTAINSYYYINYNGTLVGKIGIENQHGFSVRCIKN